MNFSHTHNPILDKDQAEVDGKRRLLELTSEVSSAIGN